VKLTLRYDRTTLYEQVWAQPVQQVAKSYGISGRGLGKICRRLLVPVPPRGYWARVRMSRPAQARSAAPESPARAGLRERCGGAAPPGLAFLCRERGEAYHLR
jgi:hypothetical protein